MTFEAKWLRKSKKREQKIRFLSVKSIKISLCVRAKAFEIKAGS